MDYHLLSDELLVKLLRVEDKGAFNEIYKRYWKELFKSSQRKVKSESVIEELLQNVFLSLWEKRTTHQIENLGGYLFNSLKYQIINHYRALILAEKYADFAHAKLEQYDSSPEESVNFQDITAIFDKVLKQLPEKTSRIFHMSRLEYKTTREISEILNLPERTVEYHITQSLRLLRQQLKDFLPSGIIFLLFNY